MTAAGFTVTRNQVKLADPIKTLGLFEVSVSLHPEVSVTVTANVARSEDEAQIQAETGKAVTGGDDEADAEAAAELEAIFEEGAAEAAAEELAEEGGEEAADEAPAEEAEEETAE